MSEDKTAGITSGQDLVDELNLQSAKAKVACDEYQNQITALRQQLQEALGELSNLRDTNAAQAEELDTLQNEKGSGEDAGPTKIHDDGIQNVAETHGPQKMLDLYRKPSTGSKYPAAIESPL